jgi:hypothetical protein
MSSIDPAVDKTIETAPLPLAAGETLKLHIYIDHSVVVSQEPGVFDQPRLSYPFR